MLGPLAFLQRWLGANEHYMRAVPAPVAGHRERDLFEGVG
jgi:hypothetical protein